LNIEAEPGIEIGDEVHAVFAIAFGNGQPASGLPVIEKLGEFSDYIGRLVNNFAVR
jgi:hypothetical protein